MPGAGSTRTASCARCGSADGRRTISFVRGPIEVARDQAEAVRLAYVAATRARDLLVVPAVGDGPYDGGWLDPLSKAIYPPPETCRFAAKAPGCPAFASKDSILKRPENDPALVSTVAPGLHVVPQAPSPRPQAPRPSVVWWDPRALSLHAETSLGLRRDDLIVKDVDMFTVDQKMAEVPNGGGRRATPRSSTAAAPRSSSEPSRSSRTRRTRRPTPSVGRRVRSRSWTCLVRRVVRLVHDSGRSCTVCSRSSRSSPCGRDTRARGEPGAHPRRDRRRD